MVHLDVRHLCDDILEVALSPRLCWVSHHGQDCVVVLLVLVVQEHQLCPEVSLLGSTQHLGDVHSAPEELEVLLQLVKNDTAFVSPFLYVVIIFDALIVSN